MDINEFGLEEAEQTIYQVLSFLFVLLGITQFTHNELLTISAFLAFIIVSGLKYYRRKV